ncbi:hypothetical protein [Nonomuraea dietziae]|uniref:hypothetical protein n=1 Tax=Nonomuraea dietziae TaxID=65515 RepID=UPI0031E32DDA
MNQRASITMSDDDVSALLRESRKLQLATINRTARRTWSPCSSALDSEGRVAFWTYGKARRHATSKRDRPASAA